jgi:hypothetical protein
MRDLREHFSDLIDVLLAIDAATDYLQPPEVGVRDNQFGTLRLALVYPDGSKLYVALEADCSGPFPVWGDYGFHYVGPDAALRFRFDNAPHYRGRQNFPYHLHLSTDAVSPYGPPRIRQVAEAVLWHLDNPGQPWQPSGQVI